MTLSVGANWAGNLAYRSERIAEPRSISEVQDLIAGARSVRPLGTRHSFNTIAESSELLISTAGLAIAPVIDATNRTVTVGAGTRYGDLATVLQDAGWALANLASLPHISIGGAIATGTHGSGNTVGSLASAVAGLELVTATGDVVRLRRGDTDFNGHVVSLGALGVVTSVTLDIEESFTVEQSVYESLPWASLEAHFDRITDAAYSVSLFTTWRNADVIDQVWLKRRPDQDAAAPADLFGATPAAGERHPLPGISAVNCTPQLGVAGAWLDRLAHFKLAFTPSNGDELQTEFLVARAHAVDAVAAVRSLADRIAPLLQVCEVRTMKADSLWLSPAYGTDTVGIHFTWLPRQGEVEALLPEIEAALAPFAARPHWGKLFTPSSALLAELYPRLDDFQSLAARLDPERKFVNAFLDETVLPGR